MAHDFFNLICVL